MFNCECIDCGHEEQSESHCADLTCTKCGGQMRRAERPGPGKETAHAKSVPVESLRFTAGGIDIGDNGENAKTAPVTITALSGKPIEHWYWGRVVHDLAGMHLHKSRLTIDYVHDDKEVIGYLNRIGVEDGQLRASGALVPYRDNDRATEILYKARNGVPYEASIFWGGDGIKLEEVPEGESVEVNGAQFDGPGTVVRSWPLRGVAICPYGADANTAAEFSESKKVNVSFVSKEKVMADEVDKTEGDTPVDVKDTPEGDTPVDGAGKVSEGDTPVEETATGDKTEGQRFLDAFGERGGVWFAQGLTFDEARAEHAKELAADNARLRQMNEEFSRRLAVLEDSGAEPVPSNPDDAPAAPSGNDPLQHEFMVRARKLAAEKPVGLAAAISKLSRAEPALYAEYRKFQEGGKRG